MDHVLGCCQTGEEQNMLRVHPVVETPAHHEYHNHIELAPTHHQPRRQVAFGSTDSASSAARPFNKPVRSDKVTVVPCDRDEEKRYRGTSLAKQGGFDIQTADLSLKLALSESRRSSISSLRRADQDSMSHSTTEASAHLSPRPWSLQANVPAIIPPQYLTRLNHENTAAPSRRGVNGQEPGKTVVNGTVPAYVQY